MKKLLSLALFLISAGVYAQITSLPITWDDGGITYTTTDFGGTTIPSTTVVDPTDPANRVLEVRKPAGVQVWALRQLSTGTGFTSTIPFNAVDRFISMRVRSNRPAGTPMMAKIERSDGSLGVETTVNTTVAAGEWENLIFNVGDRTGLDYRRILFAPNFLNPGDNSHVFWLDNVAFGRAPKITSISSNSGTTGDVITISGQNFTGATSVSFGGFPGNNLVVVDDNTITVEVGAGGTGRVRVTTPVMFDDISGFTFIPPAGSPTITSFSPTSGGTGTVITINGTNLGTVTAVNFGGDAGLSVTPISATQVTAVVNLGNSGAVAVTNPIGVASLAGFTYIPPAPTVTSFTPTTAGGQRTVTITGTNFIDVTGPAGVRFGGTNAASYTVVNPTTITAVVGAGATGQVTVTNAGGTGTSAATFNFLSPISLPITFDDPTVDYSVRQFDPPTTATVVNDPIVGASNKVLRIVKSGGLWTGAVLAKDDAPKVNNGGFPSAIPFTATNKFIRVRVYSTMPIGTEVLCKVENTGNPGINAEVRAATTSNSAWHSLTFNIASVNPALFYERLLLFVAPGVNTSGTMFFDDIEFLTEPTISSFSPTSGPSGTLVTINGTNFSGATAVSFGGVPATGFTVVSPTQITATVGLGSSGPITVTRGATATSGSNFTFLAPLTAPTITSFTPTTAAYGATVTITGTNFSTVTGPAGVRFGGTNALSYTVDGPTQITAVVGGGSSGTVSVTNPDGVDALAGFTFLPPAQIDLPITWDSPFLFNYGTGDFNGAVTSVIPEPGNPTNSVLRVFKNTGALVDAGSVLGASYGPLASVIPFTASNRFISVRVFSPRPIGTPILLKIERAAGSPIEVLRNTTVTGAWEEMIFDFGTSTNAPINYSPGGYNKLVLFCNFGNPGTGTDNTFYIDDIKFLPGPSISSFTPTSAPTGTTVTISGTNLSGVTSVSFGGVAGSSVTVINDNQVTAVVGAGFSGNIVVTNSVGSGSISGFDWIAPPGVPSVLSFTPTSAFPGTNVTITGSNFNGSSAVKFGGTDAASFVVVNSSTIVAEVGLGSSGSVSVTNGFGTNSRVGFTYLKRPISLPITWEDNATVQLASSHFNGMTSTLALDPLDIGNTVLRLTKGTDGQAGATLGGSDLENPLVFTLGNTVISVRFFNPRVGLRFLLKVERPGGGAPGSYEREIVCNQLGWQVLEFDFALASVPLNEAFGRLVVIPGFASATPEVSYIDNIRLGRFPTNVWRGITSTDFLRGSNWSLGFPPLDCNVDVQINANTPFSPILASGSYSGGNVDIKNGATFTVNSGATYSVCGNLVNGNISGAGNLVFNGTSAQAMNGLTTIDNVTVTKPAASGVVTINGMARVQGVVTLSNANSSIVVAPTGSLVLVSNATRTGSIAAIPAGASVTGNVTQQRYLPGTGDGWFLLGTPIQGGNFSQWTDNMSMAAGTSLGGNQGVVSLGMQHSTIFKYDESLHAICTDTVQKFGWRVPELADALTVGKGFRVWLKSYNTPTRTIDNVGTINAGDFNFPTLGRTEPANCQTTTSSQTTPCVEANRGWNFLANPYPSAINWDATGGVWTKPASMQNTFWRWNSAGGGYGAYTGGGSYVGAGPAPASPNLIPSGQGFFVKLTSPGVYTATLAVREGAKSNSTGSMLRTAVSGTSTFKMKLEKPSLGNPFHFLGEVRFSEEGTDGFDSQKDVPTMDGGPFSFSMPVEGERIIANHLSPLTNDKTVPLDVNLANSLGEYKFTFSGMETFEAGTQVYLRDLVLGTITNITENPVYTFGVNSFSASNANRFELIFSPDAVTSSIAVLKGIELNVFPNPASGSEVVLALKGAVRGKGTLVLTDVLGKEVARQNLHLQDGINENTINIKGLASGVYSLKVSTPAAVFSQKLVIK